MNEPEQCPYWCDGEHDQVANGRCHGEWAGIDTDDAKLLFRPVLPPADQRDDDTGVIQIAAGNSTGQELVMTLTFEQETELREVLKQL